MSDITVEQAGPGVALVTLNRPEKMNAFRVSMFGEFREALEELECDEAIRAVVLTGSGKAFCAGHDLRDVDHLVHPDINERIRCVDLEIECLSRVHNLGKPVIAAINGAAMGGGLALATGATLRVASSKATFGTAFINLDLCSDAGLAWTLPRLVGYGVATELMLTGSVIDAQQALEISLVNRVVSPASLINESVELASVLASKSPLAVRLTRNAIEAGATNSYADTADLEVRYQMLPLVTPEAIARREAFTTKDRI